MDSEKFVLVLKNFRVEVQRMFYDKFLTDLGIYNWPEPPNHPDWVFFNDSLRKNQDEFDSKLDDWVLDIQAHLFRTIYLEQENGIAL